MVDSQAHRLRGQFLAMFAQGRTQHPLYLQGHDETPVIRLGQEHPTLVVPVVVRSRTISPHLEVVKKSG